MKLKNMAMIVITFVLTISLFFPAVSGKLFYDVDVSADVLEKDADRKNAAIYQVEISNVGEKSDTYELQYTNTKSDTWVVSFVDFVTDMPEISVGPSKTVIINVSVRPSCGCEEGNKLDVDITAYSKSDKSTFDKVTLTTTYKTNSNPDGGGDPVDVDSDNDGWTDEEEISYGTNPFDKNDFPFMEKDSDSDGLTDAAEESWGTNPYLADTDGDGDDDFKEYQRGTDPLDPNSHSDASTDDNNDSNGSDSDKNIFGMNINVSLYLIVIILLVVVILVGLIILIKGWGKAEEKNGMDAKDKNNNDMNDADTQTAASIETLDVKPKKIGSNYECPVCKREFKEKSIKKHLLRTHHKRLKRL